MKDNIAIGLIVGLLFLVPLAPRDFGWSDTAKLERVAVACEAILVELRAIRAELKARQP